MIFRKKQALRDPHSKEAIAMAFMQVIDRTQATIQFKPDGTILTANQNFLDTLGYSLLEVVGKHHSMFCDPAYVKTEAYRQHWADLAAGKFFTDQFRRIAKDGSDVWIQATYAPVLNDAGVAQSVIKIATNITPRQKGIAALARGLDEMRGGNLSYRVKPCDLPDIDLLAQSYNSALTELCQALDQVKEITEEVTRTASVMERAANDLSGRTEAQAATLEETAAAVEELNATARSTAEGAHEVETSASGAKATAESGGKVVESAIGAMAKIDTSSKQISQIISVIDDIAFQTNLLALNAGVEAARAGDAGRGFAVVASEVRSLAQRSAQAAGEIKGLIQDSARHVSSGVSLVGQAGDELQKIIGGVSDIYGNITAIARSAAEQSSTLSEINNGVSQLDQVTQNNAAMVEETTAATQTLAGEARKLAQRLEGFQTDGRRPRAQAMEPVALGQAQETDYRRAS